MDYEGGKDTLDRQHNRRVKEGGGICRYSFIYCEAQESQKQKDWIKGHINAFEHIGGVPDNLKAGVGDGTRGWPSQPLQM